MAGLTRVTATGDVATGVRRLYGVVLTPDAAASARLDVRDGSGGAVLLSLQAATGGNSAVFSAGADTTGIQFATGIHATISGTNASATFHYA